jgi:hypothetical protein
MGRRILAILSFHTPLYPSDMLQDYHPCLYITKVPEQLLHPVQLCSV